MNKWMKKLTAALCAAQIHYDCLMPCIFSPIFHENTPVSSIIPESESISKFFDRLKKEHSQRENVLFWA